MRRDGRDLPGHLLRKPFSLAMLVVLVGNDFVLKRIAPSDLSGKLSDIAGLVLLPLAFVSLAEGVRYVGRHPRWQTTRRELYAALGVTALGFIAVKSSNTIGHTYGYMLGVARWLPAAGASLVTRRAVPTARAVSVTHDVTDLLALPALGIAWLAAAPTIRRRRYASRQRLCTRTSDCVSPT